MRTCKLDFRNRETDVAQFPALWSSCKTLDPFHNFHASVSLCIKWDYNDVLVSRLRVIVRRKFVQEKCSEESLPFVSPEFLARIVHPEQPPALHLMQLVGGFQRAWAGAARLLPFRSLMATIPWPFTGPCPGDSRRSPRFPF